MKFSHIFFDLDGTLTDPKEGISKSIQFALGELGIPIPHQDTLDWCIGPPLSISFARLLLPSTDPALIQQAIVHYRIRFADKGLFENTVYAEIPQVLERIHRLGILSFVATSKPHVFATQILDHFALSAFFIAIYGSELDGTRSDKGELIAHILKSEGIDPTTVLMVGDREHDIIWARKNGVRTAAVTYGYGTRQEIEKAQPDFIFEQPRDLAAFLEQNSIPPV